MKLRDSVRTAFLGLSHAKTRSALTMLGIIIGIASVIVLMSIGTSAQNLILNEVQSIGSNLIFVVPGGTHGSRFSSPAAVQGIVIKTLVEQDLDAIRRESAFSKATAEVRGQTKIVYGNNDTTATYEGTTPEFFDIRNFKVARGKTFTQTDMDSFNHVIILGQKMAATLFANIDPLNKQVRLKDASFRIIGILEKKGLGPFGIDQDNLVILPITIAQKQLLGINHFNVVTVQASDAYNVDFAKARLISILRQNHHITDPNKDDFTVQTQQDSLLLLSNITSILTLFLTAIASISLVVGGIGIMNIMLVSVIERTREIGLRKAVGATNGDVMQQFLWESVMLTFFGGVVGIFAGSLLVVVIYFILVNVSPTGWTFALPPSAILLGVGVSSLTGIVFGLYPARQAAKKSPIEALRYE